MSAHYQVLDRETGKPSDGNVINLLGACLTWKQYPNQRRVVQVQGLSEDVIAEVSPEECEEFLKSEGF